ncbi:hypothetical protein Bbelb_154730 [Branchiostoma belcheri]|nr:hypothetical protein Bbelb_154730 [Branchiostoma belcheri]
MTMQEDITVNDECDMKPYAVADMSDHETYLSATTNVRQQAPKADSIVTGDGDMKPNAVTDMSDHETYFSRTTNIHQQASGDSTKNDSPMQEVNNLTTPNATELTSTTIATIKSADSTDSPSLGGVNGTSSPSIGGINDTSPPSLGGINGTSPPSLGGINGTSPPSLGGINGTSPPSIGGINGTSPPSIGGINGTSPPSIGGINGTSPPIIGGINGTSPPSLGGINGTSPPSLGGINGTSPPSIGGINATKPHVFGSIDGTRPPNGTNPPRQKESVCEKGTLQLICAADELIVIDDPFSSYRGKDPPEVKKNVTFGGWGKGTGQFLFVGGLAVSSNNEIFVSDGFSKRIKVFSIKGVFLRSFSTGNMKPRAMCMGHNDTLLVVSYPRLSKDFGNAIQQYSKEGSVLTKFNCSDTRLNSIAWDKLSGRIILSLNKLSARLSTAWLSPTYTQTEATPQLTCDMTGFGSTESMYTTQRFVTVDKKGNIFMTISRKNHVEKYDKNGVYLSSFGSRGTGAGNLYQPKGICVDSLGRVIVADTGNSRVEMFTAEGKHIRTIAYITRPKHVATGGDGQLVVINDDYFVIILPKY